MLDFFNFQQKYQHLTLLLLALTLYFINIMNWPGCICQLDMCLSTSDTYHSCGLKSRKAEGLEAVPKLRRRTYSGIEPGCQVKADFDSFLFLYFHLLQREGDSDKTLQEAKLI